MYSVSENHIAGVAFFLMLGCFSGLAYLFCDAMKGSFYEIHEYGTPITYSSNEYDYFRKPSKEEYKKALTRCKRNFKISTKDPIPSTNGIKEKGHIIDVKYSKQIKNKKKWLNF